jgi:hypothetical protein
MVINDTRLVVGDCIGIVSSTLLDEASTCRDDTARVIPWRDVSVTQLTNAPELIAKFKSHMQTLGDVTGMQLQTVALQYDNAIVQVLARVGECAVTGDFCRW